VVEAVGQHTVIRGGGVHDENSLEHPQRIVPQVQSLGGCAKEFPVTLPPLSVNVLEIPAR
jgi:alpha-L-arabinofuranosidase